MGVWVSEMAEPLTWKSLQDWRLNGMLPRELLKILPPPMLDEGRVGAADIGLARVLVF